MLIRKNPSPFTQFSSTRTILLIVIVILLCILGIKLLFFRSHSANQPTSQTSPKNTASPVATDPFTLQVTAMFDHNTFLISGPVRSIDPTTKSLRLSAKTSAGKVTSYTIKTAPDTIILQKPSSAAQPTYQPVSFEEIKVPYTVYVYGINIPANNQIQAKGLSVDIPPTSESSPMRHRVRGVTP